jgi:hypothetical protein
MNKDEDSKQPKTNDGFVFTKAEIQTSETHDYQSAAA